MNLCEQLEEMTDNFEKGRVLVMGAIAAIRYKKSVDDVACERQMKTSLTSYTCTD